MHSDSTIEYLRIVRDTIDTEAFIDDYGRVCYTDMEDDGTPVLVTINPEEAHKILLEMCGGC